ncbi:MAG TPA: ATP-binding protein [Candidatus Acidoferrales bacterium]|nr:ATP-binding protein [Candidatus Acidoferrales bacterium]
MRISLFWNLALLFTCLLAAALVATAAVSPGTLGHWPVWLAVGILVVGAGAMAMYVARSLSLRMKRLEQFAGRMAEGDFTPVDLDDHHDEISELSRAMNKMAVQRKEALHRLAAEHTQHIAILESMIEGVAVVNHDGRVVFSNGAFLQILLQSGAASTVSRPAATGRLLVEAVRQTELLNAVRQVLATGQRVENEITVGTLRPRTFAVTVSPVRESVESGATQAAVLVLHDITELRRLERVRRDFVANVSHEFKTPLTAIQGFAETLLGGALDDTANRERFVTIIRDHSVRLARLTNDLLKLTQFEAGRMELDLRPVKICDIAASCVETIHFQAEKKLHAVELQCPPDLPPALGDAGRIREVLTNLLENAVQYTPPGGHIDVSVERRDDRIVVTVGDDGIGIPRTDQERIFERFYRVDTARSREAGGTGLGLSIARHIVESHGGRIWLESDVGEGSKFHFSVPVAT